MKQPLFQFPKAWLTFIRLTSCESKSYTLSGISYIPFPYKIIKIVIIIIMVMIIMMIIIIIIIMINI